jgi:predicted transposase YdaD
MAIVYDKKTDVFYQEGFEEAKKELIVEMLKDGTLTIEKIASLAKVSVEYVRQVAKELKK